MLLRFEQVVRQFPAAEPGAPPRRVLDGVDFSLEPGQVVALVGRSGAGKTTLLHLASGLDQPDAGHVWFDGRDLAAMTPAQTSRLRRHRIGLVFQNNLCLNALPVWENVALPLLMTHTQRRQARRQAEAILEQVGLEGLADASTAVLSGGQRRRLGIARAMLGRPDLLLADEPTADLDEETGARIERMLFDWLLAERRAAPPVTASEAAPAAQPVAPSAETYAATAPAPPQAPGE
ncbi:MAG TPA: ATP-binding cassette domain-containing protein, partial [Candidatus Sumerlaeota bacterium]|nr:ATP-binding cassette domain-containing protein [Candidatus Sumerlaeota bacterium]